MATKSIMLIVVALMVLAVPGIFYNNLNNNGLVVAQSQAVTCSTDPQTPTCQISGNVACQASSSYCNLSGSSISFLNGQSPFTQLIQGNLFALFTNLNPLSSSGGSQRSWSGNHGPFDITGNPVYYSADCYTGLAGATLKSQTQWVVGLCTQTNTDNSNISSSNAATWNNWNTDWNTTVALKFYRLGNATFTRSCNYLAQINYTLLANGPGYTYFGCTINQAPVVQLPPTNPTHRTWGYLIAMPVSYGPLTGTVANKIHYHVFIQLSNWHTQTCLNGQNLAAYASQPCTNFLQGFNGVSIFGVTLVPNNAGAVIWGFLAGVILLLGGLGLQLGIGGGLSAGVNEGGTRLFQALGIGLIVWTFLYSQFATWFTSGLLPYGFDGAFGIMSVLLSGMFFFGVFWRSQSRD